MVKETSIIMRKLAHNDPAIRKAAFKALSQYLQSPSGLKLRPLALKKLWKGLYYSMWFCDKPVPQQDLAGDLGELFSKVVPQQKLAAFHRAFWEVMRREWHSIDKWRIDKYLMIVRRVLRHFFLRLAGKKWRENEVEEFLEVLREYPLANDVKFPQSLAYHVCDIYLDEIEYVIFKDFRDYNEENEDSASEEFEGDNDAENSDDESEFEADDAVPESFPDAPKPVITVPIKKEIVVDEATEVKKKQILSKTPVRTLVEPFVTLATTAMNEGMRIKCQEEIVNDERVKSWGIVEREGAETEDETGF